MKIRTRTSIAAVAVASVIGGGVAGAVLTGPAVAVAQEAEDETSVVADSVSTLDEVLAQLVEDGVITEAQADAVAEALEEARPQRGLRGFRGIGPATEELAETLSLTVEGLRDALREGSSLADLASEQGIAVDTIVDQLVAQAQERLDAAVADGRLTADEAAERLENIEAKITEMVNGELTFGRRGFGHDHRGPRGFGGSPNANGAANADDVAVDA
jgi:polyhydroxyalkanoate synthesis regulator phasin